MPTKRCEKFISMTLLPPYYLILTVIVVRHGVYMLLRVFGLLQALESPLLPAVSPATPPDSVVQGPVQTDQASPRAWERGNSKHMVNWVRMNPCDMVRCGVVLLSI
jgi:hypothetical protein